MKFKLLITFAAISFILLTGCGEQPAAVDTYSLMKQSLSRTSELLKKLDQNFYFTFGVRTRKFLDRLNLPVSQAGTGRFLCCCLKPFFRSGRGKILF